MYRASDLAPALTLDGKGQVATRLLSSASRYRCRPSPPVPRQTVNAQLEDKIALLGYDTSQQSYLVFQSHVDSVGRVFTGGSRALRRGEPGAAWTFALQ